MKKLISFVLLSVLLSCHHVQREEESFHQRQLEMNRGDLLETP